MRFALAVLLTVLAQPALAAECGLPGSNWVFRHGGDAITFDMNAAFTDEAAKVQISGKTSLCDLQFINDGEAAQIACPGSKVATVTFTGADFPRGFVYLHHAFKRDCSLDTGL